MSQNAEIQRPDGSPVSHKLVLTFLAGIIISALLFQSIIGNNLTERNREFYNRVLQQYLLITRDISAFTQVVENTQAFFAASQAVHPHEFRYFGNSSISRQSQLLLFAWFPDDDSVHTPRETEFLYIKEGVDPGLLTTIVREPAIRDVLAGAATAPVTAIIHTDLGQTGNGSEPLIARVVPTYGYLWRKNPELPQKPAGRLLAVLRIKPFVMQAARTDKGTFREVSVFLNSVNEEKQLIYHASLAETPPAPVTGKYIQNWTRKHAVARSIDIPLGPDTLSFSYIPSSEFLARAVNWTAWLVLLLGIILTLAIAVFLQLMLTRSTQIRELVKKRTRELEESEETQRAILRNIADGVLTMDESGIIHSFNPACEGIFGYSAEEVIGQNIKMLIPQPYWGDLEQLSMGAEARGIVKERTGSRKDGAQFPMEISFGGIRSGTPNQYVAVIRNISDRKEAEEKLRRSNQALDDFVYIVSHDLKEPLRSIQNFSAILEEDCDEALDTECRAHVATILRVAKRMQDQLDSLLKFSRASHQEVTLEDVSVETVVEEVKDSLQALILEAGAAVKLEKPLPVIRCDRSCMVEIFTNLIQNAIKYRREDIPPVIEIGAARMPPGGSPVLYVKDNGIGIAPEHSEKIFKMFQRLHGRDQYGGGTGSGLAIVKKLVERHNGEIWVESAIGKGSTFFFTLQEKPYLAETA